MKRSSLVNVNGRNVIRLNHRGLSIFFNWAGGGECCRVKSQFGKISLSIIFSVSKPDFFPSRFHFFGEILNNNLADGKLIKSGTFYKFS